MANSMRILYRCHVIISEIVSSNDDTKVWTKLYKRKSKKASRLDL